MQALARSFFLLTLLSVMSTSMELAIKSQSREFEEGSSGVEEEEEDEGYLDFDDYSVDDDDYDDFEEDEYEYEDDDYEYDE